MDNKTRDSSINTVSSEKLLSRIKNDISRLSDESGLREDHIIKQLLLERDGFPVSIFSSQLGILESIVKFSREELHLKYEEIGNLLRRDKGPIGVSYRKANKKMPEQLDMSSLIYIPFSLFSNTVLTAFENIVFYMKQKGFNFREIGILLRRNERTIWTTYKRAEVKLHE